MTLSPAAAALSQPDALCPCGSGRAFTACCQPVLQQQRQPATAEELMRSRFTAHAVGNFEHLHRTYLPTAGKPYVPETDAPELGWTRLVVHAHETGAKPDLAFVDFTAYFAEEGGEQAIHEKSEFLRVNGAWFYTRAVRSGPALLKTAGAKVGRNDPCPCGSGKKFKHCHGR